MLLTTDEAADYLRISTRLLAQYRADGRGPTFSRLTDARGVRYQKADLDQWVRERSGVRSPRRNAADA